MPDEHYRVLGILRHCKGRSAAVGNRELARLAKLPERRVRHIVKDLIEQFGESIGTAYGNEGGHFIIATDKERKQAVGALLNHAASTFRRAHKLDRTAARETLGQLDLELK
jgi:hypothetical protein